LIKKIPKKGIAHDTLYALEFSLLNSQGGGAVVAMFRCLSSLLLTCLAIQGVDGEKISPHILISIWKSQAWAEV
jgi:hypothetical protein